MKLDPSTSQLASVHRPSGRAALPAARQYLKGVCPPRTDCGVQGELAGNFRAWARLPSGEFLGAQEWVVYANDPWDAAEDVAGKVGEYMEGFAAVQAQAETDQTTQRRR